MAENPRIEELRRRVAKDPASIAFAQLAEEFRRSGNYEEAIDICRAGLQTHPSYLSARVTLGRALLEINELEGAEAELRYVLQHASENLAAIRAMAEIHHRRGELTEALVFYKSALELARHDPDLEQTVDEIERAVLKNPPPAPVTTPALTPEEASAEFFANTFDLLDMEPLDLEPDAPEPVAAEAAPEVVEIEAALPVEEPTLELAEFEAALAEPMQSEAMQATEGVQAEPEAIEPEPIESESVQPGAELAATPEFEMPDFDFAQFDPAPVASEPELELDPEPVAVAPVELDLSMFEELPETPAAPEPPPVVQAQDADMSMDDFFASLDVLPVGPDPVQSAPVKEAVEDIAPMEYVSHVDDVMSLDAAAPEESQPLDDMVPMEMGVIGNPALPRLQRFLETIQSYRQRRAV